MRKRAALVVTVVAVLALTALLNVGNVYAQQPTTTTVICDSPNVDVGSSVPLCNVVVVLFPSSYPISATGETITWSQSGTGSVTFPSGNICLLVDSTCLVQVTGATAGGVTLKASYPGDATYDPNSGTYGLTVNSMLVAPTVTATAVISQGQSTTLTSTPVTTGTPPYTYQWLVKGPTDSGYSPISGAIWSSYTFTTSASTTVGVWSFELKVTDSDPAVTSNPVTVTVNPATTTTTAVNCSPSAIDVGSSSSCTATVSGASGSISGETITWSQAGGSGSVTFPSGSTCTLTGTSCSITVNGASVGNPTIQASYPLDTFGNAASSGTFSLTVNSMLLAPTITATQTVISQDQSTTLTSTPVTTGTPPYTYQWLVKGPADSSYSSIPGATSSSYTFTTGTSTAVGVWSFELRVTDSDPSILSNALTVTVNPSSTTIATTAIIAPPHIPAPVGGVMLPSVGFSALLPWVILLSLLGVLSVEAFRVKRRAKRR